MTRQVAVSSLEVASLNRPGSGCGRHHSRWWVPRNSTHAVKRDASDIHFDPGHEFLRIRYRIDSVLRQSRSLCATTRNLSVWTVFLWFEIRTALVWISVTTAATRCFSIHGSFSARLIGSGTFTICRPLAVMVAGARSGECDPAVVYGLARALVMVLMACARRSGGRSR